MSDSVKRLVKDILMILAAFVIDVFLEKVFEED